MIFPTENHIEQLAIERLEVKVDVVSSVFCTHQNDKAKRFYPLNHKRKCQNQIKKWQGKRILKKYGYLAGVPMPDTETVFKKAEPIASEIRT